MSAMSWLLSACLMGLTLVGCGVPPSLSIAARPAERAQAQTVRLGLARAVTETAALPQVVAAGPGAFDNALALNVPYAPIRELRQQLDRALGRPLDFFRGWNPEGEAHVTVLTPVEYQRMVTTMPPGRQPLSMREIGELAAAARLQQADLQVLGLGSGRAWLEGRQEETYFVIVESRALRQLRRELHARHVRHGGDPAAFDPARYFPHITVGFTRRDLHEADGVLKDLPHSRDARFRLELR